jgi:8-oxo-dGTP diphosphatase
MRKRTPARLRARVAAKVAIFRGDQILMLHRASSASDPGVWDLPGGVVHEGESLARAARREVREETGFEVRLGPMFYAEVFGSVSKRGKIRPTVGVFFQGNAPRHALPRLDPREHVDFAWVTRNDLKSYPTVPYLERTVRAAFSERTGEKHGPGPVHPDSAALRPQLMHVRLPVAAGP